MILQKTELLDCACEKETLQAKGFDPINGT